MLKSCDVAVVGGGVIGLFFAAYLSWLADDLEIYVIQDVEPDLVWDEEAFPDRVSAINRVSQQFFELLGLWGAVLDEASPYFQMSVWKRGDNAGLQFDRTELGEPDLGHIVSNRILQKTLWNYLAKKPQIHLEIGKVPESLAIGSDSVDLSFENKTIRCRLLIGADGALSWVHQQAGFMRYEYSYEHVALTTCVNLEKSHSYTAFQCFASDEILAFLPLKKPNLASIVWSVSPQKAECLKQLSSEDFDMALTRAIEGKLGFVRSVSDKLSHPLKMRHSKNYVKERVALIGDAIHTIHPLAGQGMNLGLLDASCLAEFIQEAHRQGKDIGRLAVLRRYQRFRVGDNWKMIASMEMIKRFFTCDASWFHPFQELGMQCVDKSRLIKKSLIRCALGKSLGVLAKK